MKRIVTVTMIALSPFAAAIPHVNAATLPSGGGNLDCVLAGTAFALGILTGQPEIVLAAGVAAATGAC